MTIDIDVLDTQHSNLDEGFRRHAFEQLRESGAVAAAEVVASSPNGPTSAQATLGEMVGRGMAILEGGELVAIDDSVFVRRSTGCAWATTRCSHGAPRTPSASPLLWERTRWSSQRVFIGRPR